MQWGVDTLDNKPVFLFSPWFNVSLELTGSAYRLHTAPPKLLGYENWWMHPDACPDNPDAFDVYIVHGYPNGAAGYETTYRFYAGYTTYYCNGQFINGTFYNSSVWQACLSAFGGDCPCAFHTTGSSDCPAIEP